MRYTCNALNAYNHVKGEAKSLSYITPFKVYFNKERGIYWYENSQGFLHTISIQKDDFPGFWVIKDFLLTTKARLKEASILSIRRSNYNALQKVLGLWVGEDIRFCVPWDI